MSRSISELRNKGQRLHSRRDNGNGHTKRDAVDLAAMKLNHRQWLFVIHYMRDPNATQAAIKAGYSEKSAYQQAYYLLKHPSVKEAMELLREVTLDNTEVSIERLVEELTDIALTDTDIKGSDKLAAIKMLFDYHYKVISPNGQPVQLVVTYESQQQAQLHPGDVIDVDVIEESYDD